MVQQSFMSCFMQCGLPHASASCMLQSLDISPDICMGMHFVTASQGLFFLLILGSKQLVYEADGNKKTDECMLSRKLICSLWFAAEMVAMWDTLSC